MKTPYLENANRRAFSFVELQVALILLGIALIGLVPLVVIQSRQLKAIEDRWDADWTDEAEHDYWIDPYRLSDGGPVYDLVPAELPGCPSANRWVRKLGAPARVRPRETSQPPAAVPIGTSLVGPNTVTISSVAAITKDNANAVVLVDIPESEPEPEPEPEPGP